MAETMMEVRKLFNMSQDGVVSSKLCEMLQAIHKKTDEEEFWKVFLNHVQKAMVYYKSERAVERVMEFISSYATYATLLKQQAEEKEGNVMNNEDEDQLMDPFLLKMLNFLVENHNSRDKAVRYRCCHLINKILNFMGDDATIDEDLSDAIYECMMIRIKDKVPSIRIQAVLALVRLQDPGDEECPVIDAFLYSMKTDTNADVRKTILANIALSRKTLPCVLERTRDIKDINRRCAFNTLAEKVSIRALTIDQRIKVLTVGLNDRSAIVKQACMKMLKAWSRSYEYNIVKLLEALDTEDSCECSKLMLEAMLKDSPPEKLQEYVKLLTDLSETMANGFKIVSCNSLSPEVVYFWYILCKHLKTMGDSGEILLQQLLPELTNFCEYIKLYAEKNFIDSVLLPSFEGNKEGEEEFILEHLLNIAGLLDFADEVGRTNLKTLVHDLLVSDTMPLSLTSVLVARYINAEKDESKFVQDLVETIADIKQPLVQVVTTAMKESNRRLNLQLARVKVSLNECTDDLEKAIKANEFHVAAALKDQISDLEKRKEELELETCTNHVNQPQRVERDDPDTMLKCLTVASSLLEAITQPGLNSTLLTLKDELIFEGVKNEDPFIRNEAVKCLGHMSLLDRAFAEQHLVLFLQVAQVDQELLQITVVQTIFDMFLMYGLEAFGAEKKEPAENVEAATEPADNTEDVEDGDENKTIVSETPPEELSANDKLQETSGNAAESVLGIMLMFIDGESADLRTAVAEGMAKLLLSGRVVSAKILTRLILLWYNPITEDDTKLRHCLGVFLPLFAFERRSNQEVVEETFLPVVKTILNAPTTSPLSRVNVSNVIELLIQLTDVRNLAQFNATVNDKTQNSPQLSGLESHIHDSTAMKLANEILSDPEDPEVKLFCKALNQLTICPRNVTTLQDLMELTNQIIEALENNRTTKKVAEKFQLKLEKMLTEGGTFTTEQPTGDDEEMQDADDASTISPSHATESTDNTLTTTTDADNTLTNTTNADNTMTDNVNDEQPSRRSRDAKHKLSSSSERICSSSKRSKLQESRTSSIDFHVSTKKAPQNDDGDIDEDDVMIEDDSDVD